MVNGTKSLIKTNAVHGTGIILSNLICYASLSFLLQVYLTSNIVLTTTIMCALSLPTLYYATRSMSSSRLQDSSLSIYPLLGRGIHLSMLCAPLIVLSPLAAQYPWIVLCVSVPLSLYHWCNIYINLSTSSVQNKIIRAFNARYNNPLTVTAPSQPLTPEELLRKPKSYLTLKRTASSVVLNKATVLRKQLPDLFCQLHTINKKIPSASKALDNPKLLKSLVTKTSVYVDAHRYLLYKALIPDHFFIANTSTSEALKSKLSTCKDIDATLQNLLSIYNFIIIHQHYRQQLTKNDLQKNLLPSFSATVDNVLAQSKLLTPPSPNTIHDYRCSDKKASIHDHLTFAIKLHNKTNKDTKLLHVSEHELLELLTPNHRKDNKDQKDLFVFKHWSSIEHLCNQHWPGTMISFFDTHWNITSIHIKPQQSITAREDPQEASITRIASQTTATPKSPFL